MIMNSVMKHTILQFKTILASSIRISTLKVVALKAHATGGRLTIKAYNTLSRKVMIVSISGEDNEYYADKQNKTEM